MRFETPQFIEIEDKIFGPFTFKQFVYMAGGAALAYVAIKMIPSPFGWFVGIPLALFALALAFYKVNSRPFIEVLQNFFAYTFKSKLYIWRKDMSIQKKTTEAEKEKAAQAAAPVAKTKSAHDLAQSLDILDPEQN